jgi:ribosome-associated translation inhibitor RaiA
MALASIIQPDHFEIGFLSSSDKNAGKARQLVDLNGSYRTRNLDMKGMGGNADVNNLGLMTMLGNAKTLTLCGDAVSYDDVRTRDQHLQIDMVRAFGSDIAQMGDFVQEIIQSLGTESNLPEAQKDRLFEMVTEIVTLKNLMNVGHVPEGQARIEALIAETANKIADIVLDGMDNKVISPAIVEFVHTMLADVQAKYDVPSLDSKITKIEGRINPENYMANSVAAVIAELTGILDNQDLSEDAQAEIETLIEKLETAIENGEPIPRDIMQKLDGLSDTYPDISFKVDFTNAMESLKDANIVMKADFLGVSVAQLEAVENSIKALETQLQNVMDNDDVSKEAKAEIETLIQKLESFAYDGVPLEAESMNLLSTVMDKYPDLDLGGLPTIIESSNIHLNQTEVYAVKSPTALGSGIGIGTSAVDGAEADITEPSLGDNDNASPQQGAPDGNTPAMPTDSRTDYTPPITDGPDSDTPHIESAKPDQPSAPEDIRGETPEIVEPDAPAPVEQPAQDEPNSVVDTDTPTEPPLPDDVANDPIPEPVSEPDDGVTPEPEIPSAPDVIENPAPDIAEGGDSPAQDAPENLEAPPSNDEPSHDGEKPCGENCKCAETFNKASRNDDGTVALELANGETVTLTAQEATAAIKKEVSENFELSDKQWQKTLDQHGGDEVKAFEFLQDQRRQEAAFSDRYVGTTTNLDGQSSVDALAAAMKRKGNEPHICDGNCKHSFNNKTQKNNTGHNSNKIDITALGNGQAQSSDQSKPKKTKKTKAPKNTIG